MAVIDLNLNIEQQKIFEENQKLIGAAIMRYVKNPGKYGVNDADDLKQIGNIALIKAIKTYKPEKGVFSTYAVTIIRNELYNETRNKSDASDFKNDIDDPYIETCASMMYDNTNEFYDSYFKEQQNEILSKIAKKYGGIAENGVNAIMLTLEGYTSKDIAQQYGVEPATVTSWISRARSKLKNEPEILKLLGR